MLITVFSPGSNVATGEYVATFKVLSGKPLAVESDISATVGGIPITVHPSRFIEAESLYILPFSVEGEGMDKTNVTLGLLTLLQFTADNMKLLTVEKEMDIPFEWGLLAVLIILLILLWKG